MFTHRQGGSWGGQSSNLYSKFTNNFGITWDSIQFIHEGTNLFRYPNSVIYSPPGNTSPDSCYAIVCGPTTDAITWGFNYFGSAKFDGTFNNIQYIPTLYPDTTVLAWTNIVSGNGRFHVLASTTLVNSTQTNPYFKIFNGHFNNTTHTINWSSSDILNLWKYKANENIAFAEDGLHGFVYTFGADSLDDPYHTSIPITWETFDGGITWTKNIFHNFDQLLAIKNKISPIISTINHPDSLIFRPNFPCGTTKDERSYPGIVDVYGNLHIATLVEGMYSNHPDSLEYGYSNHPLLLFDVIKTNSGWGAVFIDTIKTSIVDAAVSGFGTGTDAQGWGHMIHISKNSDGTKVFVVWTDTDPSIDTTNIMPEVKAWGFDMANNLKTNTFDFATGDGQIFFLQTSDVILKVGNTYKIPCSYVNIYESGPDPLAPQKHYFLNGVEFNESDFNIPISINDISQLPQMVLQPVNIAGCTGTNATFSITALNTSSYQWKKNNINIPNATTNNLTIQNISNADTGSYYCIISNSFSSDTSNIVTLSILDFPINLSITTGGIDSLFNSQGIIYAQAAGGTIPYNYLWFTGETNDSIIITSAGNYCVTVTDSFGCKKTACHAVSTLFNVTSNIVNTTCFNICKGSITLTVSGESQPFHYLWSNGDTTALAINLCPGQFSVTITDANLNSYTGFYEIFSLSNITANINFIHETCGLQNGSATAIPNSGVAPYLFSWSNGSHNTSISNLNNGNYFVTITDSLNCIVFDTVTIQDSTLTINFSTNNNITVCDEASNTLYAIPNNNTPFASYLWSTGQTSNTIIVFPFSTTTYFVTVSSGTCSATDSISITVLPCHNVITGVIFNDINENGIKDVGEEPITDIIVHDNISSAYASSNSSGVYRLYVDTGYYEIAAYLPLYSNSIPTNQNAYFSVLGQVDTANHFGIHHILVKDVEVYICANNARPGFSVVYNIFFKNIGALTTSGSVKIVKDSLLSYTNSSPVADNVSTDTIKWNYVNLAPDESRYISLELYLPPNVSLGTTLNSNVTIYPIKGDTVPENNYFQYQQIVTGSFDPNDKAIIPKIITPGYIKNLKPLVYTIRFQNTGTDTAFNIIIRDTLCNNVNAASLKLIGSSHPCLWRIYGSGIAEFKFNNILLPDSNTNEPLSNGFVMYIVKPKDSLNIGDTITNLADIFFDFNQPVRTNTVTSVIEDPVSVTHMDYFNGNGVNVFPNPFSNETSIQYSLNEPSSVSLEIFNILGDKITVLYNGLQSSGTHKFIFNSKKTATSTGVYFVKLKAGKSVSYCKIVKTE